MYSPTKKSVTLRIFAALIGLTVTASLAACSNNDEDDNNPELGKTTDASVSESTEFVPASEDGPAQNVPEPHLSAVATENSEEGAEATLEYFWSAEEYARLTGITNPLEIVASEHCEFCTESIEGWTESYGDGYWNVPKGDLEIEIEEAHVTDEEEENRTVGYVFFSLLEPGTDFYNSEGQKTEESFDAPEAKDWFALMYYDATAQRWEIDWIGLEESITWEDQ